MRIAYRVGVLNLLALALLLAPARAQEKKEDAKGDKPKDLIVGKWKHESENAKDITLEFTKDGKILIKGELDGNVVNATGSYKFVADDKMDIDIEFMGEKKQETLTVEVTKDKLTTTDGKETKHTFKRAK
jgi:uncharacterized protein (TIGR03066 family)